MSVLDEAVYLLNNEKYLHLRENTSGVGYATYDKLTLLPLEKGQIPFEYLPPDGRNAIPAARNWFLFELSDDPRRAIQLESVRILDNIPDSGIRKRRIWKIRPFLGMMCGSSTAAIRICTVFPMAV